MDILPEPLATTAASTIAAGTMLGGFLMSMFGVETSSVMLAFVGSVAGLVITPGPTRTWPERAVVVFSWIAAVIAAASIASALAEGFDWGKRASGALSVFFGFGGIPLLHVALAAAKEGLKTSIPALFQRLSGTPPSKQPGGNDEQPK